MTQLDRTAACVEGRCDPAFTSCLDAFEANFTDGDELGAACAIYVDGHSVMEAWGGLSQTNPPTPWTRNTIVPVFSVTKGIAALCVLTLVARGLLELDKAVAHYWPEFGAHGKDKVTVREALGHRAGVPVISGPITLEDLADHAAMAARLAQDEPLFEPGTAHIYHAVTIGWVTSELVRRVTGQPIGRWFRENLADPLSLNTRIGGTSDDLLPIATVEVPPERDTPPLDPMMLLARPISLNGLIEPRMSGLARAMNDPAFQQVEMAGANGLTDARSLAALYAAFLGSDAKAPLVSSELLADACAVVSEGNQWGQDQPGPRWGAGLMLPWAIQPMLGAGSFGHDGAGGALAFAHIPSGVSFAYVRNRTGVPATVDQLVYNVVGALAGCLGIEVPTNAN